MVRQIDQLPPIHLYAVTGVLLVTVFLFDVLSGPEIASSTFYLLPVSILAWHRGWRAARFMSLVSMIAWLVADKLAGHVYTHPWILYWNAIVRGSSFFIVAAVLSQLRRAVEEEQRMARTDSLTNVSNSRAFYEYAHDEVERQHRYHQPLSIVFLDCDNFKQVNDVHGHGEGDELLRIIASAIDTSVRSVDVVARLGGDEFAILLPETDAEAADVVCSKIRDRLHGSVGKYNVTFSMGVVTFLTPPADVDAMLRAADEAMYDAKKGGKNSSRHRVVGDTSNLEVL